MPLSRGHSEWQEEKTIVGPGHPVRFIQAAGVSIGDTCLLLSLPGVKKGSLLSQGIPAAAALTFMQFPLLLVYTSFHLNFGFFRTQEFFSGEVDKSVLRTIGDRRRLCPEKGGISAHRLHVSTLLLTLGLQPSPVSFCSGQREE